MHTLAIAEASTAFTLSASEQELSFLAISQMISKGKVQAQELRTQLAEKMPTALTAMVRAWSEVNGLDFTNLEENTNKFYKAMDRGEVLSKQVIPLFSKHLRQLTAESGALDAALKKVTTREGRARGRLQENIKDSFNESAPMFAEGWDQLRDALIKSKPAFTAFSKLLGTLFAGGASLINLLSPVLGTIGNFVNAVAMPFNAAAKAVNKLTKETTENLTALDRALGVVAGSGYVLASAFYYVSSALAWLNDALTVKEGDGALTSFGKGLAALAVGLLPTLWLFKKLWNWTKAIFGLFG